MKSRNPFRLSTIKCLMAIGGLSCGIAQAAVDLPGGDIYLNGEFDEITYGDTGFVYIVPFLYTSDLAVTESPSETATTTNLTYSYSVNGLGSSMATITYKIGNAGKEVFNDLRFIVDAQADGDGQVEFPTYTDFVATIPSPWGGASAGDPSQFQIVEYTGNFTSTIVANNGLNGTNGCGATCDVEFALQWNLAQINPGEVWSIVVALSDDGQALSSRALQATSAATDNTVLTFSGNASVSLVPLPPAFGLYLFGLAAVTLVGRKRLS